MTLRDDFKSMTPMAFIDRHCWYDFARQFDLIDRLKAESQRKKDEAEKRANKRKNKKGAEPC